MDIHENALHIFRKAGADGLSYTALQHKLFGDENTIEHQVTTVQIVSALHSQGKVEGFCKQGDSLVLWRIAPEKKRIIPKRSIMSKRKKGR